MRMIMIAPRKGKLTFALPQIPAEVIAGPECDGQVHAVTLPGMDPDMEARSHLHELVHADFHARRLGNAEPLKTVTARWHEFAVANPQTAEKYGYDVNTRAWTIPVDSPFLTRSQTLRLLSGEDLASVQRRPGPSVCDA